MFHTKWSNWEITTTNREEWHVLRQEILVQHCYALTTKISPKLIIDVGAHCGIASLFFKTAYPEAKIIAIEPNPNILTMLEENIWQNSLSNIEVWPYAIGQKAGKQKLFSAAEEWYSVSSLRPDRQSTSQSLVEVITLSSVLKKFPQVDLLKIDIEGEEKKVLTEAKDFLPQVKNLLVECHLEYGVNPNDLNSILKTAFSKIDYWYQGKYHENLPDLKKEKLLIIRAQK